MEWIARGMYTQEFRAQAVRVQEVEGLDDTRSGEAVVIAGRTLKNWVYAARRDELSEVGKTRKPLTDVEMELGRVKCELTEVKMERDLLKKAAGDSMGESNT